MNASSLLRLYITAKSMALYYCLPKMETVVVPETVFLKGRKED